MSTPAKRLSDKRNARRRSGLCIYCGRPALPNRSLCSEHSKDSRGWQRNARARRERAPWATDATAEQRFLRSVAQGATVDDALTEAGISYSLLYAWGRYDVRVIYRLRSAVGKRVERLRGNYRALRDPLRWVALPYNGCSACVIIDCSLRLIYEGYTRNSASALTGITVGRVESHVRRCARAARIYARVKERTERRHQSLITCADCGAPVQYGRPGRRCPKCRYDGAGGITDTDPSEELWRCGRCGRWQLAEDIWVTGGCLDCTRL